MVEPESYLVAFKDYKTRTNWYKNAADIDVQLQKRINQTKSTKTSLVYIDAPTMLSYQVPHRVFQELYCRQETHASECTEFAGFDPKVINLPMTNVQVRKSSVGENAGRGLFALQKIPYDSTIGMDDNVKSFRVDPSALDVIMSTFKRATEKELGDVENDFSALYTFIEGK